MPDELVQRYNALMEELAAIGAAVERARQRTDLQTLRVLERSIADTQTKLVDLVAAIAAHQKGRTELGLTASPHSQAWLRYCTRLKIQAPET